MKHLQPVNLPIVGELEDEFINYSVDSEGAADEFQVCIGGVVKDEIMAIETRQLLTANATRKLKRRARLTQSVRQVEPTYRRNVIYVWFLYHGAHCMLNRTISKFIVRVLLPD